MHRLLAHQLAQASDDNGTVNLEALLRQVENAYVQADLDRQRSEQAARSMCDEMEQLNAYLNRLAQHDPLTQLPNRGMFRDVLIRQLCLSQRDGISLALLAIDLDRFKSVNEALGYPAGDLLLKQAAERMRGTIRHADTIARVGADDFLLLQTSVTHTDAILHLAERLLRVLSDPFDLDGQPTRVSASIGIALSPQDGRQVDELMTNADVALSRAKASGWGQYCLFQPGIGVVRQRELEQKLAAAVADGSFDLAFQPIFGGDLFQDVAGFEALLRWPQDNEEPIPPDTFIPIAESTGLIAPIGDWVLQCACREAAAWPHPYRIAINVSPRQFISGDFPAAVESILSSTGLAASRLEIEITETVLMKDADAARALLHRLKAIGVRIALDDFGTGYSSLAYLQRFPIDKVKIDKSFVQSLRESANARAIVAAILSMCRQLHLEVTAEGIETVEQLDQLRLQQCDYIQGFLVGRPIAWRNLHSYIARQTADRRVPGPLTTG